MLTPLSTPNFFPGQLLDYRDFNRVASHADEALSLLGSKLLSGGGILLQSGKELTPELRGQMTLVIQPGTAVLPNGRLICLREEQAVALGSWVPDSGTREIRVGLTEEEVATDPYTDPHDPSVQGFRSRERRATLVQCTNGLPTGALELFRVVLSPGCEQLRLATDLELWQPGSIVPVDSEAVIDTRHRRAIVPLTLMPLAPLALIALRTQLYQVERCLSRLGKIFRVRDEHSSHAYLAMLHAEVLNVPAQPLKLSFLLSEFAGRLSSLLESISHHCKAGQQENFDREGYLDLCATLSQMRQSQPVPRALPFECLSEAVEKMERFCQFAEQRFTLLNAVEEALADQQHRLVDFEDRTTLAGQLFQRVDRIQALDEARTVIQSHRSQVRQLSASYPNGDQATRSGVFMKDGKVTVDFCVRDPESPVVLWFPRYCRRAGTRLEYRINGKVLCEETLTGEANRWNNKGLVLRPEVLVPQGNRLQLRIDQAHLDFGFFELAVYQPAYPGVQL